MSQSRQMTRRLVSLGAGAVVIAIPIVLMTATWRPLEPMPRGERQTVLQEEQAPERTREERRADREPDATEERSTKRPRARDEDPAPARATPVP